jgi:hypothetical protein
MTRAVGAPRAFVLVIMAMDVPQPRKSEGRGKSSSVGSRRLLRCILRGFPRLTVLADRMLIQPVLLPTLAQARSSQSRLLSGKSL